MGFPKSLSKLTCILADFRPSQARGVRACRESQSSWLRGFSIYYLCTGSGSLPLREMWKADRNPRHRGIPPHPARRDHNRRGQGRGARPEGWQGLGEITAADPARAGRRHCAELAVHTVGGGVTPAQALLEVVALDSWLGIEAMVRNRGIGLSEPNRVPRCSASSPNCCRRCSA
jgi:hypothetical protein